MKKNMIVHGYLADGSVRKVKGDYSVIIEIPFVGKVHAEACLDELSELKEVMPSEKDE